MNKRFPFGEGHAHIFMNGADYHRAVETHKNGPDELVIRLHLQEYQKRGISFDRDGGDHFGASFLARKLAPEYGITFRTPGFAIPREGRYGKIVGRGYGSREEYRELLRGLEKHFDLRNHGCSDRPHAHGQGSEGEGRL